MSITINQQIHIRVFLGWPQFIHVIPKKLLIAPSFAFKSIGLELHGHPTDKSRRTKIGFLKMATVAAAVEVECWGRKSGWRRSKKEWARKQWRLWV